MVGKATGQMSKHLYLIHAWDESPESCWYQWLKQTLEAEGYAVTVPAMPNPGEPKIGEWLAALKTLVPNPNEETCFVGHSIGCQTILRYLADLPEGQRVGGAVFVAPWTHLTGLSEASRQIAKPWIETPIDWQAAKEHCPKFRAFFSDNDEWVPLTEEEIFRQNLAAKTIVLPGYGHFDQQKEFPELMKEMMA